jgi:glycosyltransferase involved in cell wall biosynthesis/predicted Zn-dependent protease
MPRRYLFGPVTPAFAEQNLARHRRDATCLAFDPSGAAGLRVEPGDTWDSLRARLPAGWQPDFVVLDLHYTTVPAGLWSAPVPLVGLAADWPLLWHHDRRCLRRCDLVLTDTAGVQALAREGIAYARAANLFGCERACLTELPADTPRDIDVLFAGSLHPAIQRERLPWLARLARLGERWRVVVRTNVYGDEYRALLRRARVVFNRSIRGECNLRAFEAVAAGALLFQEAGNLEVPALLRDRQHHVAYTDEDLEQLLDHYLTHEDERRAIADAARALAGRYSFERLWDDHLELIEQEWPGMVERAARRPSEEPPAALLGRTWQMLSSNDRNDPALVADLQAALAARPRSVALHNALGLAVTLRAPRREWAAPPAARQAAEHFRRAWECDPTHAVAGLNLAEALALCGQRAEAAGQARRVLALLDWHPDLAPPVLESGHFPPGFDHFRVEWERAAWANAGRPAAEVRDKRALLRWRLHALLTQLTGDLAHAAEAALLRPDLPPSQALLGSTLARLGRPAEAAAHLRQALADNPFDRETARGLFNALGSAGQGVEQERLVRERRLLARAAPQVVPVEDWFAPAPPVARTADPAGPRESAAVVWEGAQLLLHSYAQVNRELCRRLIDRGHDLLLLPTGAGEGETPAVATPGSLTERFHRPLARPADVHVRNQWPPRFDPPPAGRWVMMLFWEFGSPPRDWVEPLQSDVDEVWVPTRYVRRCLVQAGVPAERVQVVPLGVDPSRFRPQAPPLPLRTRKRFKFLFVGGTIHRKGINVLLDAYARAFTAADDVCLVVKDLGAGSFYRGQTAERRIAEHQARAGAAEVEYLNRPLTEEELAGLYTACDCLAHPYRGEGFGLPIAEAMACGLPAIVTGYGAALDFCDEATAYLLPARVQRFAAKRVGDLETVDHPWLAEPDPDALRHLLRHVVEHPEEARAKGRAASAHVHDHLTWDQAADVVEWRLRELRRQPARRLHRGPVQAPGPAPAARPRVSLCLIVRNEEGTLERCLRSAADLVDETVVVDTGSADGTREVARRCGAKVFDFAWVDSFAAARNESIRRAGGDWIFWLDADEWLGEDNRRRLRELFARLRDENAAYVMRQQSLARDANGSAMAVDQVRLFRNHPDLRWQYRVHEQILLAIRRAGHEVRWTDVAITHGGYQDAALSQRKLERNVRLLERQRDEGPDDPITLYNLGSAYQQLGRLEESLRLLGRSLEVVPADYSIRPKLYALLARGQQRLGRRADALATCRAGLALFPEDVELLFLEGVLLEEEGDATGAEASWRRLLALPRRQEFASRDAGLASYRVRQQLGRLYLGQGRSAEAEEQWRAAVRECPGFTPAWQELAELYLAERRWPALEEVVRHLGAGPSAGRALREVLALAPDHAEARQNLQAILTKLLSPKR